MFILQNNPNKMDLDTLVVKDTLRWLKEPFNEVTIEMIKYAKEFDYEATDIPVGDLYFVKYFLSKFCKVSQMNPIEVPIELQDYSIVKRNYSIVKGKNLPKTGRYFVKDVSNLKNFSYQGNIEFLFPSEYNKNTENNIYIPDNTIKLKPECLYQVSEIVEFISEYRCFIRNGKVLGIQFYIGDPLVTLSEYMIKEMQTWALRYSSSKYAPRSYSMDVGVIEKNGKKQMALIGIHPITSLGLYGFYNNSLPDMYADGIKWYININRGINECRIER